MRNIIFILSLGLLFILFAALDLPNSSNNLDGKALYKAANCASCHGKKGKSLFNIAPSLRNPKLTLKQRIEIITNGSKNDPTMIAFSPKYSKAEIKAIADYTMTFVQEN